MHRLAPWPLLVAGLVLLGATSNACSSSRSAVLPETDGTLDAGEDGTGPDGIVLKRNCTESLESYCSHNRCPMTWERAKSYVSWCSLDGDGLPEYYFAPCDGYELAGIVWIDTGNFYIYDLRGALTAVYAFGIASEQCVAGPAREPLYQEQPRCHVTLQSCAAGRIPHEAPRRADASSD